MIEVFRSQKFNKRSSYLLGTAMGVIENYQAQNIVLTLRQLYYQLVAAGIIPNVQAEYKKLGVLLTNARYCGLVDWEMIEDRIRVPKRHAQFDDLQSLVKAAIYSYRLDRWKGQEHYVELFTEKDALSSILEPITQDHHIYFNVNRGYASATALYDTYRRFVKALERGQEPVVLYLGDHDPSGLDMIRDIKDRLCEFFQGACYPHVQHIAITREQIDEYQPPPNPAKITDTRAAEYIATHGDSSWEVDALPPEVLNRLVNEAVESYIDPDMLQVVLDMEQADIAHLKDSVDI